MTQSVNLQEYYLYYKKCELLLQNYEIRFAGFIDNMGNLIAGGFRDGVTPFHDESEMQKLCIENVLIVKTLHGFDYNLGKVEYTALRRNKVVTFTFKFSDIVCINRTNYGY